MKVQYSQKQTIKCSAKIVFFLLILLWLAHYVISIDISIVWMMSIAFVLIPLQALFFDLFGANTKILELSNDSLIFRQSPNLHFSDTDEILRYSLDEIEGVDVFVRSYSCLRSIRIRFKGNKKFDILGFYIENSDFEKIYSSLCDM